MEPEGSAFTVGRRGSGDRRGAPISYPLLSGMTGQAEIIVAEQAVIAYLFEPVRALEENDRRGP